MICPFISFLYLLLFGLTRSVLVRSLIALEKKDLFLIHTFITLMGLWIIH